MRNSRGARKHVGVFTRLCFSDAESAKNFIKLNNFLPTGKRSRSCSSNLHYDGKPTTEEATANKAIRPRAQSLHDHLALTGSHVAIWYPNNDVCQPRIQLYLCYSELAARVSDLCLSLRTK